MDLFPDDAVSPAGGAPHGDFATEFARLVLELDPSSRISTKNQPLERFIATATGWPSASIKSFSDVKNLTNRIGEAGKKKVGASRNVVVLMPEAELGSALRTVIRMVGEGRWDLIAIGTRDRSPPQLVHVVHAKGVLVPQVFVDAFPALKIHSLEETGGAIVTPPSAIAASAQPEYSLSQCSADTGVSMERLLLWRRLLERKKQLVFQGPPGTGKTFLAKRFASTVVANTQGEVDLVQFHPSMSYEDFVQGIRASVEEGEVRYTLEPGRFLQFCNAARATPDSPFVLIIDEFNRGNVSRILGELMYLLEYRGESISLAQGEEPFSVPPNVYLIATMNTADRSIALVDHALRRRFAFVFLGPDYERLRHWLLGRGLSDRGQLVTVLERINQRIEDKHYQLGTSYFLSPGAALATCLQEVWEGEIEPHLDEFFFDRPTVVEEFSWKNLAISALSWWADAAHSSSAIATDRDLTGGRE